ncbi:CRISPR-associated protein Csd2 [Salinibacter ruber]|uniref:type I CRISPR-associated protein Cas7 n=1 Tax=Salinibacter ruber TaxID=146919 RepID=UPI002166EE53|nr:type I CRISPR-associated protein Cas7 [Salinibacter ruber]MCS4116120.1 CRISPR-associated protein Csd2 [Salinibacter ruber]MCS4181499.1 CRISPR-associated protein Csd2 [Salinibacter ruber]
MNPFDTETRHDLTLFIEAVNSNPNGDPNLGNRPRHDAETGHGVIRDGALKRRARDWMVAKGKDVLVQPSEDSLQARELQAGGEDVSTEHLKDCIDVRLFGHVATANDSHNQIWGPVQIGDATSVDPVDIETQALTRSLKTTDEDSGKGMGREHIVRYGLYRAVGSYSPNRAGEKVTEEDLKLLYQGLLRGWEYSTSSSRPEVSGVALGVVTHKNPLGNAPRRETTDLLQFGTEEEHPRSLDDYNRMEAEAPGGTELTVFEPYDEVLEGEEASEG